MTEIHPNFKAGYENMKKIASTKHGKKVYGHAVAKALAKAKAGLKKDYGSVYPLAEHKSLRRNISKQN